MADYRYVKCKFWSDPYIQDLEPDEKTVFLWCFTNEHSNQAGVYPISLKTIAFETGYPIDRVSEITDKLNKDEKIVYTEDKILWVKNFLRHQPNRSEKVLKRIALDLKELNQHEIIKDFLKYYDDLSIPYRYGTAKRKGKGKGKSKEKENSKGFDEFWEAYPKKKQKQDAFSVWEKTTNLQREEILKATPNYASEVAINNTEAQYIQNASTFLNPKMERWKDYLPDVWTPPKPTKGGRGVVEPPSAEEMAERTRKALEQI